MIKKSHLKHDAATDLPSNTGTGNPVETVETNETPNDTGTSSPANSVPAKINWEGNPDYFQTGRKAGHLKPRARAPESKGTTSPGGLDFEGLKATAPENAEQTTQSTTPDKKKIKEEKKLVEAKVASKLVMRALDLITGWISGGTYGADFTEQQTKARNKYREELESDWNDYLMTLDIPMHPALVCILGSVFYVAPAMETPAGKERVQSLKEKIFGKIGSALVRKMVGGK
jgi:hypothetical protein